MELNLQPMNFSRRRAAIWCVAVAWFTALCWWHRNLAIDDAWITFRYGRNVAQGLGFVFNPGEHIEGYTNYLWVILAAFADRLRLEPLGLARAVSWLSVVVGFAALIFGRSTHPALDNAPQREILESSPGSIVKPQPALPFQSATAALLLCTAYQLAAWTMGGLETAFYTMLLLGFVLQLYELWKSPSLLKSISAAILLALLTLTRLDGFVWTLLLFVPLVRTRRDNFFLRLILPLFIEIAVAVVFRHWREATFGEGISNTVRAKLNANLTASLHGIEYLAASLSAGLLAPFVLASIRVWRSLRPSRDPIQNQHGILVALCAVAISMQCAIAVLVGGDWMPGARFLVPILPLLCILAALAIRPWPFFVRGIVILYFFAAGFLHARDEPMMRWFRWEGKKLGDKLITETQREIGIFLRQNAAPTDVFAATEAGVVPYYSRLTFIDMLGLVDLHIASMPGGLHEKFDATYVLSRSPQLILLGYVDTPGGPVGKWLPDQQMAAHPAFLANYAEVKRWPRDMDGPDGELLSGWMVLYTKQASETQAPQSAPKSDQDPLAKD